MKTPARTHTIILYLFFAAFLGIGLSVARDYGISWDEPNSREHGIVALRYIIKGDQRLLDYEDRDYGPAFEMLLVGVEKGLRLTDPRTVYVMRHAATFLLFYISVIFFYLLCKKIFQSRKIGLVGSLFLILSPRIFADSFYNSKDIPCMSLFIISTYTLIRYLDEKTLIRAFAHALACAILIDIRVVGLLMPLLTALYIGIDTRVMGSMKMDTKKVTATFAVYMFFLIIFTVLFWPTLWKNPLRNFVSALWTMSRFEWPLTVFYFGRYLNGSALPWHYLPVWVAISTPIAYILTFCIGYCGTVIALTKNPVEFYLRRKYDLIYLLWLTAPALMVMTARPVMYDAWRQMFFVYPALVVFALLGLRSLFGLIKHHFHGATFVLMRATCVILMAVNVASALIFMVRYHPYQNLYFNRLAGKDMKAAQMNFELDYWGLSYRKALEYIVKHDSGAVIKLFVENVPGELNAGMLDPDDRKRLVYVKDLGEAKYFVGNYRWFKEYPFKDEYCSIKINGASIIAVYRL